MKCLSAIDRLAGQSIKCKQRTSLHPNATSAAESDMFSETFPTKKRLELLHKNTKVHCFVH